ncbi:MAG: hypothetical protein ACFFCM_16615, partial [Promethearchaeota archaeon]
DPNNALIKDYELCSAGDTPLDIAKKAGKDKVIKYLTKSKKKKGKINKIKKSKKEKAKKLKVKAKKKKEKDKK